MLSAHCTDFGLAHVSKLQNLLVDFSKLLSGYAKWRKGLKKPLSLGQFKTDFVGSDNCKIK